MWHKVSRSSKGSDSPTERYLMGRSSVLFYRKHATGWHLFIVIPWRIGSTIKTIMRLILTNRIPSAKAYMQGLWDGILAMNKI
jgi:hypothetical protein